ncbi:MAG: carbon-nitrogen hydrolase family protein [Candidatus Latescibacteria bacterium]|nr:carbon-nitrogen hydrolase family protein [Candidatus Latescibacterota bacterium]
MALISVAVIQMDAQDNIDDNRNRAVAMVDEAASRGARLVVLPEVFVHLDALDKMKAAAETIPGPTSTLLQEVARRNKIYLVGGSFFEKNTEEDKVYNTNLFLGPDGSILSVYRKIHLFEIDAPGEVVFDEAQVIESGKEVVIADSPFGVIGFTICYDVRFPELYRALADRQADIITVPAAFAMKTGKDHWEPLLRARAIENQVFILASSQVGTKPNGFTCYGRSMIIDPWGTVLAQAQDTETIITAQLDMDYMAHVRRIMPALKNRRL